jgi:glycosyltransferase involved in cell wall biosynthesis
MARFNQGISVVVCCYNSADRLQPTIRHLALQEVPQQIPWELIVVNNSSTDKTEEIVKYQAKLYPELIGKINLVNESRAGLSFARQKGASKARYSYLIFCDDDNWLDPDYLNNAFQIMENDRKIGALGGKSTGFTNDGKLPEWFESVKNGYAVGPQSPFQGDVSKICTLWGAGLVTRTELFLKCFDEKYPSLVTDRMGSKLSAGGDDEICFRILLKGYKLYYDERLLFVHFIPKERCSIDYFEQLFFKTDRSALMELNNYSLLHRLATSHSLFKPFVVGKILLGYLSTILLARKSWSLADAKIIFYYYTKIDFGISLNTKMIYKFYKSHSVN